MNVRYRTTTVAIDSTRNMKGFVAIKDNYGLEMARRPISTNDNVYTFDRLPVYPGAYFVQVFADQGRSVYTTGVTFEPLYSRVPTTLVKVKGIEPKRTRRPFRGRPAFIWIRCAPFGPKSRWSVP